MIKLIPTSLKKIKDKREAYLKQLPKCQAFFLELMVLESDYYWLRNENQIMGYTIIYQKDTLVELCLPNCAITEAMAYFKQLIDEFNVVRIFCQSIDDFLMCLCLSFSFPHNVFAYLFRESQQTHDFFNQGCPNRVKQEKGSHHPHLDVRLAQPSDLPCLLEQEKTLCETPEELERFITNQNMHLFFDGDQLIGCGFLVSLQEMGHHDDIGMWVHPDYRRQGFATKIVSYLKNKSIHQGRIPVAGCAIDNRGSRRALEKNGFIARHSLIEFYVLKIAS